MEWMLMPYRKLYRLIEGRSSRQEYWMFTLFNVLVLLGVLAIMFLFVGGASALDPTDMGALMAGAGIFMMLLLIPIYAWAILAGVAGVAVTIRRLHDLNLSGWLYLGFFVLMLIPFVNFLAWIGLIVVMCLPGTAGPNKYGEDPLNPVSVNTFE
ncbi:MAG: DUF805 domain-containing protein [Sphingomonadaceae bacterium]|nr:DUF805 domain-containing protein [Sphingomonadaceae bacterium]MCP5383412.1 DUF805 domain-containing protein [Altererythrobacter sp.]MCP5392045.1 DUF805 domain-containing protein [Sphingomonadaceae bacterium]